MEEDPTDASRHAPSETKPPAALAARLRRGMHEFDDRAFFEAHESWEAVWLGLPRDHAWRSPIQGMIQIAAGLVKWERRNDRGTRLLLARGLGRLASAPGPVTALARLDPWRVRLRALLHEVTVRGCGQGLLPVAHALPPLAPAEPAGGAA